MAVSTRKMMDKSFTSVGVVSIGLLAAALLVLLLPIVIRGAKAYIFRATVEHDKVQYEMFDHGDPEELAAETALAEQARQPVYDMVARFEEELSNSRRMRREYEDSFEQLKEALHVLLGPFPGEEEPTLPRDQYGQTRWDRTQVKLDEVLLVEEYDYSDPTKMGVKVLKPRVHQFEGTSIEPLFGYVENNIEAMMRPQWTFFWRFLTETSTTDHFFGGIGAEVLGTFYLTFGAVLFAIPMGVISAIYLVEYANEFSPIIRLIRSCVTTLAGVPSIVFGLFGLQFFIYGLGVSDNKSVLAGSMTLAAVILPFVIRASEEALRSVPRTYKEASLSLGATKWRTITKVILPASLPGILTGMVISMGRAAGETAPIMFTAAVSTGAPLALGEVFNSPTLALPWGIYNLCTEHAEVDEIRHVQYGMVLTLVLLVLLLNSAAIFMRARISRKLRG